MDRKQERGPQIPRWQKVPLAALAVRVKDKVSDTREALEESMRLFSPDTVIGWHRDLVRRKWTFKQGRKPGRPPIDNELEGWIVQVARDIDRRLSSGFPPVIMMQATEHGNTDNLTVRMVG